MRLKSQEDLQFFELLQTPIWVFEHHGLWFANQAAKELGDWTPLLQGLTTPSNSPEIYTFFQADHFSSLQCTFTPITIDPDRKATLVEASLDHRIDQFLRDTPDAIFVADTATGNIIQVNPQAEKLMGYSAHTLVGMHHSELFIPDQREQTKYAFQVCNNQGGGLCPAWQIQRSDGTTVCVDIYGALVEVGGRRLLYGFFRDTSVEKTMEENYRSIFENAIEGIFRTTPEGQYLNANPALATMYGYDSPEQLMETLTNLNCQLYVDPAIRQAYLQRLAEEGAVKGFRCQVYRKDGKKIWVEKSARAVRNDRGDIHYIEGFGIDVTERIEAETALQIKTAELDRFFSCTLDLLCIADTEGYFRRLNSEWEKTLGYRLQDLEGVKFTDYVHPDDLEATSASLEQLSDQKVLLNFINRYRCRDGTYRWIEWRSFPCGELVYASARDITANKQAEAALEESRTYYRSLAEDMPQCMFRKDLEGKFTFGNRAFLATLGIGLDELKGKSDFDFYPRELAEKYTRDDRSIIQSQRIWSFIEEHQPNPQAETIYVEVVKSPIVDIEGKVIGIQGIFWDVTKQHQDQQRLEEREYQLQLALSGAQVLCWDHTLGSNLVKGVGTFVSDGWLNTTWEMSLTEALSRIYPADIPLLKTMIQDAQSHKSKFLCELRLADFDSSQRWFLVTGEVLSTAQGQPDRVVGITLEITEKRQRQQALDQERQKLSTILEGLAEGVVAVNPLGEGVHFNQAFLRFHGIEHTAEIPGNSLTSFAPLFRLCYPNGEPMPLEEWPISRALAGEEFYRLEALVSRTDIDRTWWGSYSGTCVKDEQGNIILSVITMRDITKPKLTEFALQASEERLQSFMDNTPAIVYLKNLQGEYTYANRNLLTTLGITQAQIIGKTDGEILPDSIAQQLAENDRIVFASQKPLHVEEVVPIGDSEHTYLSVKFPIFDPQGAVVSLGGISTDITDLKQAESALKQRETYLDTLVHIQQQLLADSDDQHYLSILEKLGEVAPASRAYLFKNSLSQDGVLLSSQKFEWCHASVTPQFNNPLLHNFPLNILFPRWIEPLTQGKEILGIVADFPATERAILEPQSILAIVVLPLIVNHQFWGFIGLDNCIEANEWEESVIGLLRSAASAISFHIERIENRNILIESKQKADAASEAKSRFLANMSHELRTPMNAVIGLTGILQRTDLDAEQQEYVETIRTSGETLLTLINDILDFSKIEADRIELEIQPFSLRHCVEEVLDLLAASATQKHLELTYRIDPEVPLWIRSDITRIRQVLLNLVSNGVKFTPWGEVRVHVSIYEQHDALIELCFAIQDTGIGISSDRVENIFDPFTQADSSITRRYGGTGLGLAISYRLTEVLGGKMWVETSPHQGSTFFFTILTESVTPLVTLPSLCNKRILLLTSQESLQAMLCQLLQSWQMEVVTSRSDTPEQIDLVLRDYELEYIASPPIPEILLVPYGVTLGGTIPTISKPVRHEILYQLITQTITGESTVPSLSIPYTIEQSPRTLRILLAEDNPVNQKVCLRMLHKLHYDVDLVSNGLEVLAALERQPYDVILMDIQMPEMDGLTATQEIRKRSGATPWIIALTADAQLETERRSFASGVNDYLTKPIRLEDLGPALQKASQRIP